MQLPKDEPRKCEGSVLTPIPLLSISETVCVPDATRLVMLAAVEFRLVASLVSDATPFRRGIVSPRPAAMVTCFQCKMDSTHAYAGRYAIWA